MPLTGRPPQQQQPEYSPAQLTLLYNLLGVRPDATRTPPPGVPAQPTIGPQPVGPQPAAPNAFWDFTNFAHAKVEDVGRSIKEGFRDRPVQTAIEMSPVGNVAAGIDALAQNKPLLALLALSTMGRSGPKGPPKPPQQQLDAIMWNPKSGFFEGIKGNKTVVSGKYDAATLKSMLGQDVFDRLVNTDFQLGTFRLDARPAPAAGTAKVVTEAVGAGNQPTIAGLLEALIKPR